jgi:hypothetical protein
VTASPHCDGRWIDPVQLRDLPAPPATADTPLVPPADGKTLLMGSQGAHVISGLLQPNVKYDPVRSFTAIAMIGRASMLLVADPRLPANSFKEMIELAKIRKLSYGSAGAGTVMNIAGELINSGANVQILHVPYRGVAPALPDLMAGRLDLLPADPPVLLPQVEARTVKPLVVFGIERLTSLPELPTTVELGYPSMIMEKRTAGTGGPAGRNCGQAGKGRACRDCLARHRRVHEKRRAARHLEQPGIPRPHRERRGVLASDAG